MKRRVQISDPHKRSAYRADDAFCMAVKPERFDTFEEAAEYARFVWPHLKGIRSWDQKGLGMIAFWAIKDEEIVLTKQGWNDLVVLHEIAHGLRDAVVRSGALIDGGGAHGGLWATIYLFLVWQWRGEQAALLLQTAFRAAHCPHMLLFKDWLAIVPILLKELDPESKPQAEQLAARA